MPSVFDRLYSTQTESSRAKRRTTTTTPIIAGSASSTTSSTASPPPIKTQVTKDMQSPGSAPTEDPTEDTEVDEDDVMLAAVLQDDTEKRPARS